MGMSAVRLYQIELPGVMALCTLHIRDTATQTSTDKYDQHCCVRCTRGKDPARRVRDEPDS
jgi:hypothetical protein